MGQTFPRLPTGKWHGSAAQAKLETLLPSWGALLRAEGCWCCAGARRKIIRVCGGACLGMLCNINLRGRYLLKFQFGGRCLRQSWALPSQLKEVCFLTSG